jgi:tetratricopeptide (TPR) repeat protein
MGIKIGLHMIVKEHLDTIGDCLRSCKDLVDYMVIAVDSKPESDETYLVCREIAGDGTYRQEWQNDFGVARNDSLNKLLEQHPDVDYILWLDGDDHLSNSEGAAASFSEIRERLEKERPYVVSSPYVYRIDDALKGALPNLQFYRHRLWKHIPGQPPLRVWDGAAHECDIESGSPRGVLSTSKYGEAVIWRDFIVIHRKEGRIEENNLRNVEILEAAHWKDTNNTRTMFYLGREYRDAGLKEKAILMLQKYVIKSTFIEEKYDALMNIAYLLRDLKDPRNAEKYGKEAFALKPELALAPAFLGELYMSYGMFGIAKAWLSYAIHAPHGTILFDEVPARTYVPHKLISKCFLKTKDLPNARRHHRIARKLAPFDMDLRHDDVWLGDNSSSDYPDKFESVVTLIDSFSKQSLSSGQPDQEEKQRKERTDSIIRYISDNLEPDECLFVLGNQDNIDSRKRYGSQGSIYVLGTLELDGLNNVFLLNRDISMLSREEVKQDIRYLLVSLPSEDFELTFLNCTRALQKPCLVIVENFGLVEDNMARVLKASKDIHFLRNYSPLLGLGIFLFSKE